MAIQLNTFYRQNSPCKTFFLDLQIGVNYNEDALDQTLEPASVGLPIVYQGQAMMWDATTHLLRPFTASWATGVWTPNGEFAGFSMTELYEGAKLAQFIFCGILDVDSLDLSHVSQTAGHTYTMSDLVALPNVNAVLTTPSMYGGKSQLNLIGISYTTPA